MKPIYIVITVAVVTFLLRVLPFIIFKNKEVPKSIKYLGEVLPYSVITILVIYMFKDVELNKSGFYGIPEIIAVIYLFLIHYKFKNSILSILSSTFLYMILVQFVFI